jgi:hypothetical protein
LPTELVWISSWEIECCGEESAIDETVTWPVMPRDGGWVDVLGAELATRVTASYEGHEGDVPGVTGVLRRIRTVTCRYGPAPRPDAPHLNVPVAGTGALDDVRSIEKWHGMRVDTTPDTAGEFLAFCGWLVDLEVS